MRSLVLAALAAVGCNAPDPLPPTGGTDAGAGACGRGVVVVGSDYQSSNVSLVSWEGAVLSASLLSSASAGVGGDVVVPTETQSGPRLAVIDRYPEAAITWAAVESGAIEGQLAVADGWRANPQDLIEVGARAYVTRHDPAPDGTEGSDVLVVEPATPAAVGRIELVAAIEGAPSGTLPRPTRMVRDGDLVHVLLAPSSITFTETVPSRVVTVDPSGDAIAAVHEIAGLHGCLGLAVAPGGGRLAVSCPGNFLGGSSPDATQSGVVVLDRSGSSLSEVRRFTAAEVGEGPFGFSVTFASADVVLAATIGALGDGEEPARDDTVVRLEVTTGAAEVVLRSDGEPFTLGEVRCAPACGACFATDAGRDALMRFTLDDGARLAAPTEVPVAREVGLPPRYLGGF